MRLAFGCSVYESTAHRKRNTCTHTHRARAHSTLVQRCIGAGVLQEGSLQPLFVHKCTKLEFLQLQLNRLIKFTLKYALFFFSFFLFISFCRFVSLPYSPFRCRARSCSRKCEQMHRIHHVTHSHILDDKFCSLSTGMKTHCRRQRAHICYLGTIGDQCTLRLVSPVSVCAHTTSPTKLRSVFGTCYYRAPFFCRIILSMQS